MQAHQLVGGRPDRFRNPEAILATQLEATFVAHRSSPGRSMSVSVIMPVRDDWASARELLLRLDVAVECLSCSIDVILVDDASRDAHVSHDFSGPYSSVQRVRVLRLRRNLGHQRAIAMGLVHVDPGLADAVLVMDADGEDTPDGARQLIEAFAQVTGPGQAVFAERSRRTESRLFRFSYVLYKIVHRVLTGVSVRVGNFSILPASHVSTLISMAELWNHYSAAYFRSGLPFVTLPIPRGYRLFGTSRMNFVSLVTHGMSAISVFGDVVGVRLLVAAMLGATGAAIGVLSVIAVRFLTDWAVPGWATYSIGLLVIILFQCIILAASFTFTLLANRVNLTFVPARDYSLFVASLQNVYLHE